MSNCNPDDEMCHWNICEHLDQGCRRHQAGTGALMLQIGQTELYEKQSWCSRWTHSLNLFDKVIKVHFQTQEVIIKKAL